MNPNQSISKVMTKELITVHPDDSVKKVETIFKKNRFHHIPVVEANNELVGIISKEDFMRLGFVLSLNTTGETWTKNEFTAWCARDIMTKYPVFLEPEDTLGLAADMFLANKFHALPILDDGELVGIITTHDLISYAFNSPVPQKTEEVA